jgi:hypothetical protein
MLELGYQSRFRGDRALVLGRLTICGGEDLVAPGGCPADHAVRDRTP